MNREQEIYNQALDLASAEERVAFLIGACGADANLLQWVRGLLRASDGADAFLPEFPQAPQTVKSEFPDPRDEGVGQKLGRYELLERIGEGGCGVVYVAEQTEPVRRRVARRPVAGCSYDDPGGRNLGRGVSTVGGTFVRSFLGSECRGLFARRLKTSQCWPRWHDSLLEPDPTKISTSRWFARARKKRIEVIRHWSKQSVCPNLP